LAFSWNLMVIYLSIPLLSLIFYLELRFSKKVIFGLMSLVLSVNRIRFGFKIRLAQLGLNNEKNVDLISLSFLYFNKGSIGIFGIILILYLFSLWSLSFCGLLFDTILIIWSILCSLLLWIPNLMSFSFEFSFSAWVLLSLHIFYVGGFSREDEDRNQPRELVSTVGSLLSSPVLSLLYTN